MEWREEEEEEDRDDEWQANSRNTIRSPSTASRVAILVYIRIRYNTPTRIIYNQTFIRQIKAKQMYNISYRNIVHH